MTEYVDYTVHTSVQSCIIGTDGTSYQFNKLIIMATSGSSLERTNYNTLRYLSLTIRTQQQIKGHILDFIILKIILFVDRSYAHIAPSEEGVWR